MTARNRKKPDQDSKPEMTEEQMSEFLKVQNKLRAEQCTAEIQKILDEYKCRINSYPVIIDGLIRANVEIAAV